MKISKQELLKEAGETGFRPEIMEKVWHLMAILDGISVHSFLKDRLVLKGGTALNLFFFDLPRLSVDIDLNYVGKLDRQEMILERPEVERALEAVFQREGLSIRRIPEKHAGGKWQLRYESALGGNGNLEVDLNFMFRTPLYGIHKQCSHSIGTRKTKEIALLDIHELGAGKLSALFGRHASRDLFDAHQLLTKCSLNAEQLRLACLVYGAMGSKDWRQISIDEIHFEEKELKDQLIPVLRKQAFRNGDWLSWTNQLLADCKTALIPLFPLNEREQAFLQSLFEHGTIDATLVTHDLNLIEKINAHPLLQWKAKLVSEKKQK
ncbi:MAG: nucleotidyl transferase AbiEii/AbiGii toxin family protein [Chlamydiota bacterium]